MNHVIIVAPPRSGGALLRQVLLEDSTWASSGLSGATFIDEVSGFSAADRAYTSHLLSASDVTPEVSAAIVRVAEQRGDGDSDAVTTIDWTPRNAVRIGLLAEALPEAKFVLMVRRPIPAMASLMSAWASQRFASVPDLPEWWGDPWAFPLIDGWRDLIGSTTAEVATGQWAAIAATVMDDLAALPDDRWTVASYEALITDPAAEASRVAEALGLAWSGDVEVPQPVTTTTVNPPKPDKWRFQWPELSVALPAVQETTNRYRTFAEAARPDLPWPDLDMPKAPEKTSRAVASSGTPFSSSHTASIPKLLEQARASLIITTYKSGHIIIARNDEGRINTEFKHVSRPMGVAVAGNRLAVGVADAILAFTATPGIAAKVDSPKPVDIPYSSRSIVFTGDIAIHDMAYGADGALYFVNTRFSCLCRQDIDHSFTPIWRPAFVSGLAAEDRCHLNGLAVVDGVPRYVTVLAQTDTAQGWRELKGTSGAIIDVTDNRVVTSGLSMPHSPRWYDGRLWVLESGKGTLATVDIATGEVTTIATLPGFTRGLTFIGPYALIGLSQVRESVFASLPITQQAAERNCGVWLVDTRNGQTAGFLKFEGVVQEIFDVQVLPATWPSILDPGSSRSRLSFCPTRP